MIDLLKTFAALIATLATIAGAWVTFGLPLPATRGYVQESVVAPLNAVQKRLLKAERRLYAAELFQWETANKQPYSENIKNRIEELRNEIAEIDRKLKELSN